MSTWDSWAISQNKSKTASILRDQLKISTQIYHHWNNPKWTGGSRVPNLTVAQVSYVNDKSHIYASKDKLEMSPGLNWVNEYNFVAGLQTWPNLNSQQRKSGNRKLGWIEFSSVRDYWFVRGKSASDFKSQKRWLKWRTESSPTWISKHTINFLSFFLTSPRSKSIASELWWVQFLEGDFVLHETILASGQIVSRMDVNWALIFPRAPHFSLVF